MKPVYWIALVLVVVGAVNWGLVGLFQFDLVAAIFGGQAAVLSRVVYALVGVAGVVLLATAAAQLRGGAPGQPAPVRARLQELRAVIKAAAPDATEVISYGVPGFKLGSPLVGYGAAKAHIGFYVMDPAVIETFEADLAGYKTSTGSISLPMDGPLPAELIRKIVTARVAANEAKRKK